MVYQPQTHARPHEPSQREIEASDAEVQRFLDDALASSLWGFDLGHANQAKGTSIYPHNFNLLYRWTTTTSNVFRDWFLIQLRRGITTNDQDPLSKESTRRYSTPVAVMFRGNSMPSLAYVSLVASFTSARSCS